MCQESFQSSKEGTNVSNSLERNKTPVLHRHLASITDCRASNMMNIVRVKRKRGLPSPAGRLYVDVNDDRLVADNLLAGLTLGSPEASLASGGASSGQARPRRAKRYRRIMGNMTMLELESQAFREGFEAGVGLLGPRADARAADGAEGWPALTRLMKAEDTKHIKEDVQDVEEEVQEATKEDSRGAAEAGGDIHAFGCAKRKQCSMIYAVVKRQRESRRLAASPGSGGELGGSLDLDPLRRLGGGYRVCDLEFTPSTPDVKSRAGEEDELYDLYVEEDDADDRGGDDCGGSGQSSSCAVVYVDDGDFFMPEFDEDHEASDGLGSEDSNAEDHYLNDYPEDEDEEGDDEGLQGFGWDSDVSGSGTGSDDLGDEDF